MGILLASHKVAYKLLIRLLGFLLVAEYIPLANRGQRQQANREESEKAVTGSSSGYSSEQPSDPGAPGDHIPTDIGTVNRWNCSFTKYVL